MTIFFRNIFFNSRALFHKALFVLFFNFLFSEILPNVSNKCFWVTKNNLVDSVSVNQVINFVKKNEIDKVFFQVRSRGDALYNSSLVPKCELVLNDFDPLDYFLQKKYEMDVEVHAWFNTYILWSNKVLPNDSLHFYYQCPECLESDFNGKSDKNTILSQYQSKNWEGIYLSPMHPKVNVHILEVINELISKYDLDGVHLDYVRYQDSFYGYNPEGLDQFISKFNFDPKDINRGIISPRFGYPKSYIDSLKVVWKEHRSNKITELVRSLKYSFINDSLNIQLSAAVKPNFVNSKNRWFQDWSSWIKEDLIDFAVIMNYDTDFNDFNFINDQILSEFSFNDIKENIFIGISCYNQSFNQIADKVLFSRFQGFENYSLFPYNVQKDTTDWYNPIFNVLNFKMY